MTRVVSTTLACGGRASAREAAIAESIDPSFVTAIILEGMPDGIDRFDSPHYPAALQIARIAPGCLCCAGNLILRVTLNRILRHPPERLYVSLATSSHLEQIRSFFSLPPYDKLLVLTKDIQV
jgi:hypothetical protein